MYNYYHNNYTTRKERAFLQLIYFLKMEKSNCEYEKKFIVVEEYQEINM